MTTTEKEIEQYLCIEIKKLSGLCLKLRFMIGGGWPDRTILLFGKLHLIEVKRHGGKISAIQLRWFRSLANAGFPVLIVWSKEDVDRFVRSVSY